MKENSCCPEEEVYMSEESGKLIVRNATPDDFERCFALLEKLYHGDIGCSFKEVFNRFARGKGSCVIVAEQHGKTLGVLIGSYHLDIDWESKVAKIQALIVEEKHRRKGIGRRLVEHFRQKAKQNGCCVIRSRVNRKNKNACLFHEKLGFWKAETYEYILEL
jgi:GNAT superfamily N-acetyltransferase